jgi:hypothetical protein
MFSYKSIKEQLQEERRKNEALRALCKDLEDAAIELAEIVAANEEAIKAIKEE